MHTEIKTQIEQIEAKIKQIEAKIANLESDIEEKQLEINGFEIDVDEKTEQYNEMLDEVYGEFMGYSASHILEEVDPTAYRRGLIDYVDSLDASEEQAYKDLEEELQTMQDEFSDLETQLEELEEELEAAEEEDKED